MIQKCKHRCALNADKRSLFKQFIWLYSYILYSYSETYIGKYYEFIYIYGTNLRNIIEVSVPMGLVVFQFSSEFP